MRELVGFFSAFFVQFGIRKVQEIVSVTRNVVSGILTTLTAKFMKWFFFFFPPFSKAQEIVLNPFILEVEIF